MQGKTRVLHIVSSLWSGGVAVLIKNYYEHMDHNEVAFDFLVTDPRPGLTEEFFKNAGCRIYHLKGHKHFFHSFFKTISIVRKNHYRIVHVHHNDTSFLQLFAALLGGAKVRIAHSHDELFLKGANKIRKFYCFLTSLFSNYHFACSQNAGKYLFGKGIKKDNYFLIHNAIDLDKFKYSDENRMSIREKYNLNGSYVMGNVGRLAEQKNQLFLLDVLNETIKKEPNSKLVLIGKGADRDLIVERAEKLNLQRSIVMIEVANNVNEILSAFDCFVFPSKHEGLGIAFLEAQASNLPCVISDRIPEEAIASDKVSVLSLNESSETWAKKIVQIFGDKVDRNVDVPLMLKRNYDISNEASILQKWYVDHSVK